MPTSKERRNSGQTTFVATRIGDVPPAVILADATLF
jgi:hypothetical protein